MVGGEEFAMKVTHAPPYPVFKVCQLEGCDEHQSLLKCGKVSASLFTHSPDVDQLTVNLILRLPVSISQILLSSALKSGLQITQNVLQKPVLVAIYSFCKTTIICTPMDFICFWAPHPLQQLHQFPRYFF